MKNCFFVILSVLTLLVASCSRKQGCPGVRYYTKEVLPKGLKEGQKGTGAWTKKNKNKDNKKAKSGIIPKNLKIPKKTKKSHTKPDTKAPTHVRNSKLKPNKRAPLHIVNHNMKPNKRAPLHIPHHKMKKNIRITRGTDYIPGRPKHPRF